MKLGVARVQKGSPESGRGQASLEGVGQVWKGSGESGRGQVSQEGLACVPKGLHSSLSRNESDGFFLLTTSRL